MTSAMEFDRKSRQAMLLNTVEHHDGMAFPVDVWNKFPHYTQNLLVVIQTAKVFDEIFSSRDLLMGYAHEQFCNIMLKPVVRACVMPRMAYASGWMASVSPLTFPYNEQGVA